MATNIKALLGQVPEGVMLVQAYDKFKIMKAKLEEDTGIAITFVQGYLSKFEIADEKRKLVTPSVKQSAPADIKPFLEESKTIADIVTEGGFEKLQKFLDDLKDNQFTLPTAPRAGSIYGNQIQPLRASTVKDPRRTGRLMQIGPEDVLKKPENRKWFINNSMLYGFVMYHPGTYDTLYYVGDEAIKQEVGSASNKTQKLKEIVGKFLVNPNSLNDLKTTPQEVIDFKLPNAGVFPDPGNLVSINAPQLKSNAGESLDLVIVGGLPVWKPVAFALVALLAEAKKAGLNIGIASGYRPATGRGGKVTGSDGKQYNITSQETLRRDKSRWTLRNDPKWKNKSDDDYVFNAPSSGYNPATAAPKTSNHGTGIAIDFSIGGRNNFVHLQKDKYIWMIKNAHRFGFVRAVGSEEWHFEYYGAEAIKGGPYFKLSGKNGANKFYNDLGLNEGAFQWT